MMESDYIAWLFDDETGIVEIGYFCKGRMVESQVVTDKEDALQMKALLEDLSPREYE